MATKNRLEGRKVLITGGASGIGFATLELFVREGARVAVLDRDADGVSRVQDAGALFFAAADVGQAENVVDAVKMAAQALGGIDGLVNGAGISRTQRLDASDLATWQHVLNVNLTGAFNVTRAALPFLQRAASATIVNVASAIALRPFAGLGAYAASKAGMIAWTKVLAQELAPQIRVNALCPGSTDTPLMQANMPQGMDAKLFTAQYAMGRQGRSEEQANSILFLTCEESSFITGISVAVDGGRTFH